MFVAVLLTSPASLLPPFPFTATDHLGDAVSPGEVLAGDARRHAQLRAGISLDLPHLRK